MAKKIVITFITVFISIILITGIFSREKKLTLNSTPLIAYASWSVKQIMVNDLTNHTDTIIFGDSTVFRGINPKELNPHVYNFALDGSRPLEAYYLLKFMIENGKYPKNIVLSYSDYFFHGSNYWDSILGFNLSYISRKNAEEILEIDQNSSHKVIAPYDNNDKSNNRMDTVRIPYYFDIAAGPLNHIKPDFDTYLNSLSIFYHVFNMDYQSRGWGGTEIAENNHVGSWCENGPPTKLNNLTIDFYLQKLIDLANEYSIKTYLLGGPIAESCVNLGFPITDIAAGIDIEKLKISGTYPKTPIPDELMSNANHTSRAGSKYFTEKLTTFFDGLK